MVKQPRSQAISQPDATGPSRVPKLPLLKGLWLACHPEPTLAVTAVSVALAVASGRPLWGVVAVGLAVLCGQLSVGWHNDWLDADRDQRAARRDKPVARGLISRRTIFWAAVVAISLTIPLSLLSGWLAGLVHVAAVLIAWLYNSWLKFTPLSFLPYTISFALLVSFICLGLPGSPWPAWWAVTAAALLGSGAHLANTVPDLEDDIDNQVRGLPHRIGRLPSIVVAAGLLIAASVVLLWGPGQPGLWQWLGLGIIVGLIGLGIGLGRRARSRWLFRATLGVALTDVVLFVIQSRSLTG